MQNGVGGPKAKCFRSLPDSVTRILMAIAHEQTNARHLLLHNAKRVKEDLVQREQI